MHQAPCTARRQRLWLILLLTLCAVPGLAHAQGGRPSTEERAARMKAQVDDMIAAIGVTGDVETGVRAILETQQSQRMALMQAAMAGGNRGRDAMQKARADIDAVDEATRAELAGMLSDEQLATYDKKMAEMRSQRGGPGGRRGQRGGGAQ